MIAKPDNSELDHVHVFQPIWLVSVFVWFTKRLIVKAKIEQKVPMTLSLTILPYFDSAK